jgi:hypothetical protein
LHGFLQAQPSESELVQAAADNATMGRAQQLLQEEKDEVKHMNRIMRYAKCAAMREQQVQVRNVLSSTVSVLLYFIMITARL